MHLRFEHRGLRWWLNDEAVNEENFFKFWRKEPEKEIKIKRFMQVSKVKMKDLKVTGISGRYIPTDY